jgi:hypothetical protein
MEDMKIAYFIFPGYFSWDTYLNKSKRLEICRIYPLTRSHIEYLQNPVIDLMEYYQCTWKKRKKTFAWKFLSPWNQRTYYCEISSSHGGEYEAQNLLGCTAVLLIEFRPTFQRYMLPPSSARTSETSVDIQLRIRQHVPEDSELQSTTEPIT